MPRGLKSGLEKRRHVDIPGGLVSLNRSHCSFQILRLVGFLDPEMIGGHDALSRSMLWRRVADWAVAASPIETMFPLLGMLGAWEG